MASFCLFLNCGANNEEDPPTTTTIPIRNFEEPGSTAANGVIASNNNNEDDEYGSQPTLSIIPTLPSHEPLELLALANEAICDRDALLACKRISDLSKDLASSWMRDQVAQCLARAYLLFGDMFPFVSRFPPADAFFASLTPEEQVMVAVVAEDNQKGDLASNLDDEWVDGLESYPVTFFRSQPPGTCSREFHAEAVMLSNVKEGETIHLQDPIRVPLPVVSSLSSTTSAASIRRGGGYNNKLGKTYYARRLHDRLVIVVCFPKSSREAGDTTVLSFLDRLGRLFVL